MSETGSFSNPHEELAYLRSKVLETEKRLEKFGSEFVRSDIIKTAVGDFKKDHAQDVTPAMHESSAQLVEKLAGAPDEKQLKEMLRLTETKGVLQALSTIEKMRGWKLEDDFHDHLVGLIAHGLPPQGIKEKGPEYKALHMSLYEVILPKTIETEKSFADLIRSMEQLYAGLLSVGSSKDTESDYMVFEIANPDGEEDTAIFVSVPTDRKQLFERQVLSIFPTIRLNPRERDYNIFSDTGRAFGATATLSSSGAYPLQTAEAFGEDPLNVILQSFSKIPKTGSGAALQIIFKPRGTTYTDRYQKAVEAIQKGTKAKDALVDSTFGGEFKKAVGEILFSSDKKKDDKEPKIDDDAIQSIKKKIESPIVETNIRFAVSAPLESDSRHLLDHLESAFNQFENAGKNRFVWERMPANKESDFYRAFTFRLFRENEILPLNLKELSVILHFHTQSLIETSTLKRSSAKGAPVPMGVPVQGTILGVNKFQNGELVVAMQDEDRLRHFYAIGQTGTGKSTLLKNMIIQDIARGDGVCMIDPHGVDIQDVLANIPAHRIDDVIYFDPASTERPMALNMLEYNPHYPEQKTFVVNELFSIFQKLYGGNPESMGPMFEQYFRNAAMLVIEDPETGSTLLDISRVLANKQYRQLKISRCKNPIVVQFWTEVADKAGGEAALANIVPYITSKFDVFLANDIMRPIIAQERSSFDFRDIMDKKKILLVNLSKGRLGDINANLIGLILVGKILMAALSRVDSIGQGMPPFYLYIDEFQNVTTNSISTILSEARKYKLSLNIAHQYIAQLEDGIKNAVFGNVGTLAVFRVGTDDAEYLSKQFEPVFTANDIVNIDNRNAYIKMLVDGRPVKPFNIETLPPPQGHPDQIETIKRLSFGKYGGDRNEIEARILEKYKKEAPSI
ncbi:MAG: TraM recognition domain-containing protein [Patescibacteria group bacterium]